MTVEQVSNTQDRLDSSPRQHILVTPWGKHLPKQTAACGCWRPFIHRPITCLGGDAIDLIQPVGGRPSFCEWKGVASYFDVVVGDRRLNRAVWNYPNPSQRFLELAGWFALYPQMMDGYWVEEPVVPQQGGFYGAGSPRAYRDPSKGIEPPGADLISPGCWQPLRRTDHLASEQTHHPLSTGLLGDDLRLRPTLGHQHGGDVGEVITVITIGPDLGRLAEEHPVAERADESTTRPGHAQQLSGDGFGCCGYCQPATIRVTSTLASSSGSN